MTVATSALAPIAIAVKRAMSCVEVFVYSGRVEFNGDFFPLPDFADEFIHRFDMGLDVQPITFDI